MPANVLETAHLFPVLDAKLVGLLRSLDAREWALPTVAPGWTVKDVAAHLLDTQQRLLARLRGDAPSASIDPRDLVAAINRLNADGIRRYRDLDPAELIARLEAGAPPFAAHHQSLDPRADAPFGVSWAGETRSANWFHTARELTERWHHQQQIRLAVGKPGIMTPELYHPVLDCFMRGLPFAYRDTVAAAGTLLRFDVAGDCGGTWWLRRDGDRWRLAASGAAAAAETTIPQEIAWLIFTRGMRREAAAPRVRVAGDARLGLRILDMLAIVG